MIFFFILLNSYAVKYLDHALERAYYFQVKLIGLFHGCFGWVLPSFEYHFNSLLLIFITGVCSDIPCSIVSRIAETSHLILSQFSWLVATLSKSSSLSPGFCACRLRQYHTICCELDLFSVFFVSSWLIVWEDEINGSG